MNLRLTKLGLFMTMLLLASAVLGRTDYTVRGTVRDRSGRALAHAYVEARRVVQDSQVAEDNKVVGVVGNSGNPWVAVDSSGSFTLTLAPGRYRIKAKDELDGYPDPSFWLGLDPRVKFPEITVSTKDIGEIEVVLGVQGGVLSGHILDIQSHNPVVGAEIRIQDAQNSHSYVKVYSNRDGYFRYTVPSKPLVISVSAPGYRTLEVESGAEQTLSRGEHREITLELNRE